MLRTWQICINVAKRHFCHTSEIFSFPIDPKNFNDPEFIKEMEENIQARKGIGNIKRCVKLKELADKETNPQVKKQLYEDLLIETENLPNFSHPIVKSYKEFPKVLRRAKRISLPFVEREFSTLSKELKLIRTEALQALTGNRSYYFLDALANLETALVRYFLNALMQKQFKLVSVPDFISEKTVNHCGMTTRGDRSQVYFLEGKPDSGLCLSGTSEMALAGFIENRVFKEIELPVLFVAASRCYRSEISNVADEKGIYRCHQFTKVEMFGVCRPDQSEHLLDKILQEQELHFTKLGLDYQILDMPRAELGAPAYRKYDIEAWFPGGQRFGEISSCSNCTDYQARRLNARYITDEGKIDFVHTVNGTACAVPRTVMALFETHQMENGNIRVPQPLEKLIGVEEISCQRSLPPFQFRSKSK